MCGVFGKFFVEVVRAREKRVCIQWWTLESERVIGDLEFVRNELNWVGLDVEEGTDEMKTDGRVEVTRNILLWKYPYKHVVIYINAYFYIWIRNHNIIEQQPIKHRCILQTRLATRVPSCVDEQYFQILIRQRFNPTRLQNKSSRHM